MYPALSDMLPTANIASFFGALFLLCALIAPANVKAANSTQATGSRYAIILASAPGKNLRWVPRRSPLFEEHTIYVEQATVKGSPWERLCLGFFSPRSDAEALLDEVRKVYPDAWIQKVETRNILSTIYSPTGPVATSGKKVTARENVSTLSDKQLDSLMKRAETDFKNKKYASSIRYLNALIAAGDHKYSQQALELSGLARQRKGQTQHAVAAYEKYLLQYPDSDGAVRVRQRLVGLQTASTISVENTLMSSDEVSSLNTYGSLSQFYQSNQASIDDLGSISTLSQLVTYFDLTTLQHTPRFDHRYQITADHVYDFDDSDDDSEFRFIDTYYELSYRKTGTSGRLGRQRLLVGGLLKRFDGLSLGYQFNPEMRLNFLGGFPVDFDNKSSINHHKTLYGFTFETGTFLDNWSMNMFYFDQQNDGLTDRNNIGSELRYRDSKLAVYGLIDYDLFYDELNILQLNSNIYFDHGRTAFLNAYTRKAPLLSTSNALIGRQENSIEELKNVLNMEQIYQLARDRTANNQVLTIGGAQPLNKKHQLSADITFAHTDNTITSGGVLGTPDTGTEYLINTQLVSSNLLFERDINIFGLRYYDTYYYDVASFIINSRFALTRQWRINPRLQYDRRKLNDGRLQNKLRAIFRTDYRFTNKVRFDFEIGYDSIDDELAGPILPSNNLFFTLGYRWDF